MIGLNHVCLSCELNSSSALRPTVGTKGKDIINKHSRFHLNEKCNQEPNFYQSYLYHKSTINNKKHRYCLSMDRKYSLMNLRGGSSFTFPSINPTIALSSLGATSQLLFAVGLGAVAASQPNLLDANAVKVLSRLAYNVFQPAFLLCNVVNTIASGSSITGRGDGIPQKSLLLMPLISLLQIIIGSVFSKIVASLAKLEGDEKSDSRVCMTFVNSATLPFIFAAALFKDKPELMADVSSCLSFYLLMWSPAFWSYGQSILLSGSKKSTDNGLILGLQKLFSPPVIGSTIGIIIGSIAPFRDAFLKDGFLSPLFRATKTLGTAYLPAAILVLSGSLIGKKSSDVIPANNKADQYSELEQELQQPLRIRTLISILFARFILSPIIAYITVDLLSTFTNILPPPNTRARAVVTFIILMEGCMPPAQNSVLILQLAGCRRRAEKMAKMLTLIYAISIVPITLLMSIALQFSGVMSI